MLRARTNIYRLAPIWRIGTCAVNKTVLCTGQKPVFSERKGFRRATVKWGSIPTSLTGHYMLSSCPYSVRSAALSALGIMPSWHDDAFGSSITAKAMSDPIRTVGWTARRSFVCFRGRVTETHSHCSENLKLFGFVCC